MVLTQGNIAPHLLHLSWNNILSAFIIPTLLIDKMLPKLDCQSQNLAPDIRRDNVRASRQISVTFLGSTVRMSLPSSLAL